MKRKSSLPRVQNKGIRQNTDQRLPTSLHPTGPSRKGSSKEPGHKERSTGKHLIDDNVR